MMDANVPGDVTITVANPEMPPLVALTVSVNVPATLPAVNRPELLLIDPPPDTMDQVGVIETRLPRASRPVAVNGWSAPMGRVGLGVTVIVAKAPGVGPRLCSQAATSSAANGTMTARRASRGTVSVNMGPPHISCRHRRV